MAYGSKKEFKFAKSKRITSLPSVNEGKMLRLQQHFKFVHELKNTIAQHLYPQRFQLLSTDGKRQLTAQAKQFNCSAELKAWEVQSIYKSTMDFYENTVQQLFQNNPFKLEKAFKVTCYKNSRKNKSGEWIYQKGDVKDRKLIHRHSQLSNLLNWLIYVEPEQLDHVFKRLPVGKKSTPKKTNQCRDFNIALTKCRDSDKWPRVKRLLQQKQQRLLGYMKVIEYTSGSYLKIAQDKGYKYSRVVKDDSNHLYQYWYIFKLGTKEEVKLPLAYNKDFHGNINNFDLAGSHYVKLNEKGRINIGLMASTECPYKFIDSIVPKQLAGIDLNVATNFCAIATEQGEELIDYDRHYINDIVRYILEQNQKGYNELSLLEDKKLRKLFGGVEFYFRKQVSELLKKLKSQGITDIVMEDLDLTKSKASYVKNPEFNIKYSRLVRLLRLSNIKHWFIQQANNLGMRLHLTTPSYTSQTCSHCHHVDRKNRKQHVFECTHSHCEHTEDADINASKVIRQRLLRKVFLDTLHVLKDGQYRPKKLLRERVKKIVSSFAESANERLDSFETPSKFAALSQI